ncbi:putative alpha/Beta hydrolase, lipase [Dioscorea sansibarensis]
MIAVNSKLKAPIFGSEITGIRRICRKGTMACLKLGFRSRSFQKSIKETDEPGPVGWRGWFKKKKKKTKGERVEVESVRGGEDLWNAAAEDHGVFPEHLVIMVNGLVGSAEDWRFAAEQFVKKIPTKVIVHRSECNSSRLTFDGVDLMGERLADEVMSVVNNRRGVQKISFVAHSLGGLIARYAIGRLYEAGSVVESSLHVGNHSVKGKGHEGRIAGLEPMNFITFATPHLGSRGHKQLPFLCGVPFLEQRASKSAHFIVGRTGKHLFLTDNDDDGKPPLLLRMAYDCDDIKFISALGSFRRRVAYANANFDHIVGWGTSSIRRQHELPKYHLLVSNESYPHIVFVDKGQNENALTEESSAVEAQNFDSEEVMIRGLTKVPWERVDVSFQKSKQRYVAHNTIQVKSYWLNSDGADVIFHMIDNFLI